MLAEPTRSECIDRKTHIVFLLSAVGSEETRGETPPTAQMPAPTFTFTSTSHGATKHACQAQPTGTPQPTPIPPELALLPTLSPPAAAPVSPTPIPPAATLTPRPMSTETGGRKEVVEGSSRASLEIYLNEECRVEPYATNVTNGYAPIHSFCSILCSFILSDRRVRTQP